MRVAIVAEGPADVAVLMNILHGKLGVERKDVLPIRPELTLDETDLSARRKGGYQPPKPTEFSNWGLVLDECKERTRLADFLDSPIEEEHLLVVHIDTAECEQTHYDVKRPNKKAADYVSSLRALVVGKLEKLLGPDISEKTRFAVAVEETDAWLLALHAPGERDTGLIGDPKNQFARWRDGQATVKSKRSAERGAKRGGSNRSAPPKQSAFNLAQEWSEGFRDGDTLVRCLEHNKSLMLFVRSLSP